MRLKTDFRLKPGHGSRFSALNRTVRGRPAVSAALAAAVSIIAIVATTAGLAVVMLRPGSGVPTTLASSDQASTQLSTTSDSPHTQTSNSATTSESQITSMTSTLRTCTDIPALSYIYCGDPLRISSVWTVGAAPGVQPVKGSWNFTVTISSNSVALGQTILLWANLTNIGPNVTFNQFVRPYINAQVYAANGTEVWVWNPAQSTWPNWNIASGETTSQDVSIPTSQLVAGQSYYITVAPISVQFPMPNNHTFTFPFSVASGTSGTSTLSDECYSGALSSNSSAPANQSASSRVVLNVTQEFDSWNWAPLATFKVGTYTFDLAGSQNSQTTIYLEPQVFINVTNSQGQTQEMDTTNLSGSAWPPQLSGGPNVLFGGNVTIQWLFACDGHSIFLEVTTSGA